MTTTSISKLKASLSQFLDIIKKGEEVIITDRGKVFAKIIPLDKNDMNISANLLELERTGLAHIGIEKLSEEFWNMPRPEVNDDMGIKAVLEERAISR